MPSLVCVNSHTGEGILRHPNIALSGKARSGKDTVAAYLADTYGYTRLALADPLKEMALSVDPLIPTGYGVHVRLTKLIADAGWDYAKDHYPEVRRTLQQMGQTVRALDSDFWIRVLLGKAADVSGPIVVTDVRYPNELASLQRAGFAPVRITRPGLEPVRDHESETALDMTTFTDRIVNDCDIPCLHMCTDLLLATL